jgi:DNA-binding CsgD family transcriptional regulator/tetratricopeptide (TPR) repeat protein
MGAAGGALLERDAEIDVLGTALSTAADGAGSVVLISGEAGIGKTSVVRAFLRESMRRATVLHGACDDLLTPRTLGPLRDAARTHGGPLARALADSDRDATLAAVLTELSDPVRPTVLVLEDVHWADDATLDVLRYVGRRVADLPAVIVVTFRDEEVGPTLRRVLGGLGGPSVRRLALTGLSRAGVARLAGGTAATSAPLFTLTAGNPFFVTEAISAAGVAGSLAVPATIVDAVLARVRRLGPAAQEALEQLAVVPSGVELPLARALLGDLSVLAEAEERGIVEVRPGVVAFRHELARRAVEGAMPMSVRMQRNARVLTELLAADRPDLTRVVHHAAEAGDDAAVVEHAPAAAREANRAGAHAQEVRLYDEALRRRELLEPAAVAAILLASATARFTTDQLVDAQRAGAEAVRIREGLGDRGALGEALVALAPIQWATTRPREALEMSTRAVALLDGDGDTVRHAWALSYHGLLLTAVDRYRDALPVGGAAVAMADALGSGALLGLAYALHGRARLQMGEEAGHDEMLLGIATAASAPHHQHVMMAYVCLVQELWRLGRYAEVAQRVEEGIAYARERELDFYVDYLLGHRHRLQTMGGEWATAESGLRTLLSDRDDDAGGSARHSLPALAQLLVRRGAEEAPEVVARAVVYARRADSRYELVPALLAEIEQAWLVDRPADARGAVTTLTERTAGIGPERQRGELLRWRRRFGEQVEPFAGCPDELAAGIRGDWRTAAAAWRAIGDPYATALELADGDTDALLEALRLLDDLGARPAAALVRRRLRHRGVTLIPRGPKPTTRVNPAGLTDRQVEILRLVAAGRTNAEIAAELVVSVRTVDHHVSAVLQKLGVQGRRAAANAAVEIGVR